MVNAVKKKHNASTDVNNSPLSTRGTVEAVASFLRKAILFELFLLVDIGFNPCSSASDSLSACWFELSMTFHWLALAMPISSTVCPVGTFLST